MGFSQYMHVYLYIQYMYHCIPIKDHKRTVKSHGIVTIPRTNQVRLKPRQKPTQWGYYKKTWHPTTNSVEVFRFYGWIRVTLGGTGLFPKTSRSHSSAEKWRICCKICLFFFQAPKRWRHVGSRSSEISGIQSNQEAGNWAKQYMGEG